MLSLYCVFINTYSYDNTRKHVQKYMKKAKAIDIENDSFITSLKLIYCQIHEVSQMYDSKSG